MNNPIFFIPIILFSLLITLIIRWGLDQSISIYISKNASKEKGIERFYPVFEMQGLYITTTCCALIVGLPVISLNSEYYLKFCSFISLIIIILSVMRMLRLIDYNFDNSDVVSWLLATVAAMPFIIITSFDVLISKLVKALIPLTSTTNPASRQEFLLGLAILVVGSLVVSILVEEFGRVIQINGKRVFPKNFINPEKKEQIIESQSSEIGLQTTRTAQ